jgi:Replication initiator protein A
MDDLDEKPDRELSPRQSLTLLGGRDEMNLAEFPITLLTDRAPRGCKVLIFEDEVFDKRASKPIKRRLTITAAEPHGLPTPADDAILVALVQLTKLANNFTDRTVRFTRYELLKLLGWHDVGKNYRRIEDSLNRWMGVTLYYDKAWWNKEAGSWVSEKFHILDNVSLIEQEDAIDRRGGYRDPHALSSFSWNEVIFKSFRSENLKRLDVDLYFSLESAISKRMYRFLDKRFYHKPSWDFDLKEFAFEHIGLSRSYDDNGKIKEKLRPAIEELTAVGFLEALPESARYLKNGRGSWKVIVSQVPSEDAELIGPDGSPLVARDSPSIAPPQPRIVPLPFAEQALVDSLISRGVALEAARALVLECPADVISSCLAAHEKSARAVQASHPRRNPVGRLVSSIRAKSKAKAKALAQSRSEAVSSSLADSPALLAERKARWASLSAKRRASIAATVRAQHPDLARWKRLFEPLCWAKMDEDGSPSSGPQLGLFPELDG